MATCGVCGKTGLRKTVIGTVLTHSGALERKRVGECCAQGFVFLLAERARVVRGAPTAEGATQKEILRPFVQAIVTRIRVAKATRSKRETLLECERLDERIETLEGVLHMLKEGRA